MNNEQSPDHYADACIKSYHQGAPVEKSGYVYAYLCCVGVDALDLLPWESKEVLETFFVHQKGQEVAYFHVVVSLAEWADFLRLEEAGEVKDGPFEDEDDSARGKKLELNLPKSKPVKKKEMLEWQRRKLLSTLKKRILRSKREEQRKLRRQKALDGYTRAAELVEGKRRARALLRIQKEEEKHAKREPEILTLPVALPDPVASGHEQDILIEITGELQVNALDLEGHAVIRTGRYPARKVNIAGLGTWLTVRPDPSGPEYGLFVRQWLQYVRQDGLKASVTISGLD